MRKNKKIYGQNIFIFIIYLIMEFSSGAFFGRFLGSTEIESELFPLYIVLFLIFLYFIMFLQTVIHELGHLLFGLATGYKFSSFRIGGVIFVKDNGKLRVKRFSLAGTAGQCLMVPPDMKDGAVPYVMYNLGGSVMNLFVGAVTLILCFIFSDIQLLSAVLGINSSVAFGVALTNGLPLKLGLVNNDGYNAFSLGKNKAALRAFWLQLKINDLISKGIRVKDMPAEWFELPSKDTMKNSMIATVSVFRCNKLIDEHKFGEAAETIENLISSDAAIIGVHRNLLICDLLFCELTGQNSREKIKRMLDRTQKKFMASMPKNLSIIRTWYAYYLLCENDVAKAEKYKNDFEKSARTYPYASEIESERELMMIADEARERSEKIIMGKEDL